MAAKGMRHADHGDAGGAPEAFRVDGQTSPRATGELINEQVCAREGGSGVGGGTEETGRTAGVGARIHLLNSAK